MLFLRDYGTTEVGGFGISSVDDLLLVQDVQLVRQVCSWASVKFDDASVADFFDEQVDLGGKPSEFGRLWIHTHPGDCPRPSGTDEQTFARVFGTADWAVMAILANGGQSYARLRFNTGPGGEIEIPMGVDYGSHFDGCDFAAWEQEYLACVQSEMQEQPRQERLPVAERLFADPYAAPEDAEWDFWEELPLVEEPTELNLAEQVLAEEYLE